jgi:hypothetical protein
MLTHVDVHPWNVRGGERGLHAVRLVDSQQPEGLRSLASLYAAVNIVTV